MSENQHTSKPKPVDNGKCCNPLNEGRSIKFYIYITNILSLFHFQVTSETLVVRHRQLRNMFYHVDSNPEMIQSTFYIYIHDKEVSRSKVFQYFSSPSKFHLFVCHLDGAAPYSECPLELTQTAVSWRGMLLGVVSLHPSSAVRCYLSQTFECMWGTEHLSQAKAIRPFQILILQVV